MRVIKRRRRMDIALCVFEKRGPKMSNFQLLFLHGFSSKNCEILNKAVLTPQEYNDFFLEKNQKKCPKKSKNLLGVFVQVKIGLKKSLSQKEFFLEKSLFEQTPPNSKKMGSKSEKQEFLLFFPSFTKEIQAKGKELESESNIFT